MSRVFVYIRICILKSCFSIYPITSSGSLYQTYFWQRHRQKPNQKSTYAEISSKVDSNIQLGIPTHFTPEISKCTNQLLPTIETGDWTKRVPCILPHPIITPRAQCSPHPKLYVGIYYSTSDYFFPTACQQFIHTQKMISQGGTTRNYFHTLHHGYMASH